MALSIDLPWPSRTLHPNARVRRPWTSEEVAELKDLYRRAGTDGVLGLAEFSRRIGRDPKNVNRKARTLGLPANPCRRVVEIRKAPRANKYPTLEASREAISKATKERIQRNGHPRGNLGKKHSSDTLEKMSKRTSAWIATMSEDERAGWTMKRLKSRVDSHGSIAPPVARGSWKAGWREIGGKRNFYRSRWEANYARYLEWLKSLGEISDWQHEPETFWFEAIRRGVRSYKPDFRVWEKGESCLHEVKGWMDDRSRTCLKRMAKYYPDEKVILINGRQYRSIRLKVMGLIEGWEDAKRDIHA